VVQQLPLATIWVEAEIVMDRTNSLLSAEAILIHASIMTAIGGGDLLKNAIEELRDGN
jgi:hypothetical protein